MEYLLKCSIYVKIRNRSVLEPPIFLEMLQSIEKFNYQESINHFIRKVERKNKDLVQFYDELTQYRREENYKQLAEAFLQYSMIELNKLPAARKADIIEVTNSLKKMITEILKYENSTDIDTSDALVNILNEYIQTKIVDLLSHDLKPFKTQGQDKNVDAIERIIQEILTIIEREALSYRDTSRLIMPLLSLLSRKKGELKILEDRYSGAGGQIPNFFYNLFLYLFYYRIENLKQIKSSDKWLADFMTNLNRLVYYILEYHEIEDKFDFHPDRVISLGYITHTIDNFLKDKMLKIDGDTIYHL